MAGKKENIKALFSNSRSRVIIIFTVILLLITVLIGFLKFNSSISEPSPGVSLGHAPGGISSTPGSQNQTAQYAALQETQNVEQAQRARQTGTSAIPTIIRTHAFGEGVDIIGQKEGQGGVDFSALTQTEAGYSQKSAWIQSLKDSHCSKAGLDKAISQGASLADLRAACSCKQLKNNGYKVVQLDPVCTCAELKSAGFGIVELKEAGFSAGRLRLCGYVACDEKGIGFTAQQMKDAGFSDGELKGAGFTDHDIAKAGGLPDGVSVEDVRKAGCEPEALSRLRAAGVTAAAIRHISGCSIAQLKAAGFSAGDLKNAGFSAADLKKAGFSAGELKQAGMSPRDLLDAGFTGDDLADAGFGANQIKDAQAILPFGLTPGDIKKAGCSVEAIKRERKAGISAELIHKYAGCTASELRKAGFGKNDLLNIGPDVGDSAIHAENPVDDQAIRAAGCDAEKLKGLLARGITPKRIHDLNGCSLDALKKAGFTAKDLADAGFTPEDLLAAGFTPEQLIQAGLRPTAVIAAGRTANCSISSLKAANKLGLSASTIKQTLGCSAKAMKDAGYSVADLKNTGFTAAELKNAGFGLGDLKSVGYSPKELAAAGWSAKQLKDAGFNAEQLKAAGFNAADLKSIGFSAEQLKAAGFDGAALKAAGFGPDELKQAGFSNQDLTDAGFSALAGLTSVTPQPVVPSAIVGLPSFGGAKNDQVAAQAASMKRLDDIRSQQEKQMAAQRYQQKIQQRSSAMLTAANQALQTWKIVPQQVYTAGTVKDGESKSGVSARESINGELTGNTESVEVTTHTGGVVSVRTGDILFAVIDTSVNSDEPGPILATIVSGRLKGSKLIGSFNLPSNASKMVVTFNTLSIQGAEKTNSITAFAIDPDTARTALSSQTNHHYLSRYGSLFAATFLEGFGNAFQSANTTITVGGTGGTTDTTVQSGIGRSTLENAVIGLATLGKAWGQVAAQNMTRPTTVELFAGTGVGVLFTQDLRL